MSNKCFVFSSLPEGSSVDQLVNMTIDFFDSQPQLRDKLQKMMETRQQQVELTMINYSDSVIDCYISDVTSQSFSEQWRQQQQREHGRGGKHDSLINLN